MPAPKTVVYICQGCNKTFPKNQVFRIEARVFPIGSNKPIKYVTLGYFCQDCLNKLKLVVER